MVSAHFWGKKSARTKVWKLLSGPSWRFLKRTQLGPDNNFQLRPDNNFQKCTIFCFFFAFKNVPKYLFYSVFENQENLAKNAKK